MSKRPWYRRYGGDFIVGAMSLTLEEKGAYSLCLDLIYDREGPIPDDARWLAGVCGVSVRKWRSLRARLIETGKLFAMDGRLHNERAAREIAARAEARAEDSENGSEGGRKRAENALKTPRKSSEKEPASNEINEVGQALPESRSQKEDGGGGDARARATPLISELAKNLADEIAQAAGFATPPDWPPGWCGAPMRVQAMLDHGWKPEIMLAATREAMARKRDGPPDSIAYFEKPFARAHARAAAPLPVVEVSTEPEKIIHAADQFRPSQTQRDHRPSHHELAARYARRAAAAREFGG